MMATWREEGNLLLYSFLSFSFSFVFAFYSFFHFVVPSPWNSE